MHFYNYPEDFFPQTEVYNWFSSKNTRDLRRWISISFLRIETMSRNETKLFSFSIFVKVQKQGIREPRGEMKREYMVDYGQSKSWCDSSHNKENIQHLTSFLGGS